eukprot:TRINITY_DN73631_c0_g1_i1.p1 TRINITY_DN73631_c0_g1~~TRINITY_DN73631_c0_g1_i1.p1  ORF type:complete len:449 (-),score=92.68 TRINITY_DN73631_c0_g1_i1:258-1406(-)
MSGNTLRECGGNLYLTYQYTYNKQLPLESIAAAGREVLKKFTNLQPASSEDVFSVSESPVEASGVPRSADPAKPFWAVLAPGKEEGTSVITINISHQEADAFSVGSFVQAWANQHAGQAFPEPVYEFQEVEQLLDTSMSPELPETSGYMSAADFKLSGPPNLGVGFRYDLGRDKIDPARKKLIAEASEDTKAEFSLNTFRMALVWKAFVAARKPEKDEKTFISWAMNVRKRVPLSGEYIGNGAINSPIVPMTVEELTQIPLLELANTLHNAVHEGVSKESIVFTLSKVKAHLAAIGPLIPRQRGALINPKQCSILYSDWSGFDMNPAFGGAKADKVAHMFEEGKPCPVGIAANNPEGVYIGLKPEEIEEFKSSMDSMLKVCT